jgi:hypothetical protein
MARCNAPRRASYDYFRKCLEAGGPGTSKKVENVQSRRFGCLPSPTIQLVVVRTGVDACLMQREQIHLQCHVLI